MLFILHVLGIFNLQVDLGANLAFRANLVKQIFVDGALPSAILGLDFIVFIAAGMMLSVCLPRLTPMSASAATALATVGTIYVAYANPQATFVPMEYTLLMILVLFVIHVLTGYFIENRARQQLIDVFAQYVPPEVVKNINKRPEAFSLAGEAKTLTVFFCDIKDFSAISEQLDPRQLAQVLNKYLTAMTDILHRYGATIDKYMGDAIMAFWGAPIPQTDHATRALRAALAMQQRLVTLRAEFEQRQWPVIEVGIGVNTGVMNVGNMGSSYRVAYTVVGDEVNLGARIEALTRRYCVNIIVSAATMQANPDYIFRELDHVRVKGKGVPTRIYEPVCATERLHEPQRVLLKQHDQALNAYYEQDWPGAEQLFKELLASEEQPAYYAYMLTRVKSFKANGAPSGWDGITNHAA